MAEPNLEELVLLGIKSYKEQDFSQAKGYFEKACDLNDGGGCNGLGVLYQNGEGVEKDLTKVAQFYSKACDLKDGWGCSFLGGLYYNGDGVKQDSKKAVALFEKACKLGYKKACEALKEK
ncbi:hypothetical protein HpBT164_04920 [Helicobacter pylori]